MTKVLTVRIAPDLLGKAEARAARLGLDRAKYVRGLIEGDLAQEAESKPHRFGSEDLAGYYTGEGHSATNAIAREKLRQRVAAQNGPLHDLDDRPRRLFRLPPPWAATGTHGVPSRTLKLDIRGHDAHQRLHRPVAAGHRP